MTFFQRAINALCYVFAAVLAFTGAVLLVFYRDYRMMVAASMGIIVVGIFFAFIPSLLPLLRRLASNRVRKDPEHSARLRALTFAGQVVGVLSLAQPTQLWIVAALAILVLAFGHRHAYQHRTKPNRITRIIIFVALHLVFGWMFVGIFAAQPYPQAQVAMLAMAVVSWEVMSRLNLYSCFGMSLINLYVAATLSRDLTLGLFLLVYLAIFLAFLWQADSEDGVKENPAILRTPKSKTPNSKSPISNPQSPISDLQSLITDHWSLITDYRSLITRSALALLASATILFIFTPHFASAPLIPPVTLRLPINRSPSSQIVNPALPVVQIEGIAVTGKSEYYYGFDSRLDLSYRGGLTDKIMMYVRSPAGSYWRSHAYDYYDGRAWTQSNTQLTRLPARGGGAYLFRFIDPLPEGDYFAQSFFIAQPMPNVVFVGGTPAQMLFPAEEVSIDSTGGIRAPETLQVGTQYTVYSLPQNYSPGDLRNTPPDYPDDIRATYLQIPLTVPQRVRDLALNVAISAPTAYDRVVALRNYLKETYPYDYFPPPQAPDTDSVDQFLFVDKRGVCEHYVSALVIMLRSLDIPARLAAGYGSGDYNGVTGYYEVHANDAHAWAEVYFSGYGWVPFDPTPGWNGDPQTGPVRTWIFSNFTDTLDLPSLPVGQMAEVGAAFFGAAAGPLMAVVALVGVVVFGWGLWLVWKGWRAGRPLRPRGRLAGLPPAPNVLLSHPDSS